MKIELDWIELVIFVLILLFAGYGTGVVVEHTHCQQEKMALIEEYTPDCGIVLFNNTPGKP